MLYENFYTKIPYAIDPNTESNNTNVTTSVKPTTQQNTEIVIKGKKEYDSLYTVDLNFNTDLTNMDANVLSEYINRRLGNHPYYIDVTQIVSIDVNNDKNSISITVSNKEVEDRLKDLQDNYVNLTSVIEDDIDKNIYNYKSNDEQLEKDIKLVNDLIPKEQKYVLNYENPKGEVKLYEYDFDGFKKAKSLNYNKHIIVNENTKRHFLRNDNDNPYFYDEYVDNENYNKNDELNNSINPEDPINVKRNLYNKIINNTDSNDEVNNTYSNDEVNNTESNNDINNIEYNNDINNIESNNEVNMYSNNDVNNDVNNMESNNEANMYSNNEVNNMDSNNDKNNMKFNNFFIIFLILICILAIFFILFNYVLKKKKNNFISLY